MTIPRDKCTQTAGPFGTWGPSEGRESERELAGPYGYNNLGLTMLSSGLLALLFQSFKPHREVFTS